MPEPNGGSRSATPASAFHIGFVGVVGRVGLVGLVGLYLGSVAINLLCAWTLGATQILSCEETSVSLRDPFFLELRQPYDSVCTNIAGHIFFWIGQRLTPEPSLFFGRYVKALAMGLVPVFTAL